VNYYSRLYSLYKIINTTEIVGSKALSKNKCIFKSVKSNATFVKLSKVLNLEIMNSTEMEI
jgi:hypothetical protein